MFEIKDPTVAAAYLLCIAGATLCVVYGLLNWNKGEEPVEQADRQWAREEKEAEEEL